ncbi:MAG: LemA family protein [Candidatus Altiarchaeota archaeon]
MIFFIIFALVVLILIALVFVFNQLITLRNRCNNQWSQIDIQLKRRNDLIPKLVTFVKEYATHEKQTFERVAEARSAVNSSDNPKEAAIASDNLSSSLRGVFAVAEAYPDLKANEQYKQLAEELIETEDKIAHSRMFYNEIVQRYEQRRLTFPSSIIADIFRFKQKQYFKSN